LTEFTNVADGHTEAPHDGIGRTCIAPSGNTDVSFTCEIQILNKATQLQSSYFYNSDAVCSEKVKQFLFSFYRATRMHTADYAVARCPSVFLSVRLSHAGVEFKGLYVSSNFSHNRVPHYSSFPTRNGMGR